MPAKPSEPEPVASEPEPVASEPAPAPSELPSWQETPAPNVPLDQATPIADWTTPVDPAVAAASEQAPPPGMALFAPAIGFFGTMVISQLITGISCDNDVYCGTRGWPWRFMGIATMGFAAGGGWFQCQRIAWDRAQAGKPAKNPVSRRAAGWTMFILGLGGFVADTTLYHLCYDDARGPYTEIVGFRYSCSPVISVVTLDLSTLLGATGLGLALSAEGQLRKQ